MTRPGRAALRGARSILLAAFVALALLPLYWMIVTAVRPSEAVMAWPPLLLPRPADLTLEPALSVLQGSPIGTWLTNAIVIAVTTTALTVVVATLAGYALSRSRRRWTVGMGYLVLVSKLLPATLLVMPLYIVFHDLGLLRGRMSLVAAILANMSFAVPFATWMMKAFFDGVPIEIEEAALVDGSGIVRALLTVVLPTTLPAIAAVCVYVFIVSWNDFIFARTFLPGGEMTTIAVASTQFLSTVQPAWNKVMVVATLAAMPVLIFFFFLERYFVSGLTRGHH
ncbi:MAG: carbohydrate ABC transporter permease [Casimicrobiaceae bacterium]